MFLHLHPINEQRATQGKPAINSLWLWGAGKTGDRPRSSAENRDLSPVFTNDPLATGLSRAADIAVHPRPSTLTDVLSSGAQTPLVMLDQLQATVLYDNPEAWRHAFSDLENQWFAPLRGQLGKTVKNVDIIAPTIYGRLQWTVSSGERWKFWKTGRSISDIANTLAAATPEGKTS